MLEVSGIASRAYVKLGEPTSAYTRTKFIYYDVSISIDLYMGGVNQLTNQTLYNPKKLEFYIQEENEFREEDNNRIGSEVHKNYAISSKNAPILAATITFTGLGNNMGMR